MSASNFRRQQAHRGSSVPESRDFDASAVSRRISDLKASQSPWALDEGKTLSGAIHARKLQSLSELLAQLAQDCDSEPAPVRDLFAADVVVSTDDIGSKGSGYPGPSVAELIDRVESAVGDLAAVFKNLPHANDDGPLEAVGCNERIGRPSQRLQSTVGPRPRSVTPRPASSSQQPTSAWSPTPTNTLEPHSASLLFPETPTRTPPSASDIALDRSLASLSIDAGTADTIPDGPVTSPSLAVAAAKSKSSRTSSQLTPSSAVHASKRSRPSMTPPSRPRFSLSVFSNTSRVSFVRTPVIMSSPTRLPRSNPSPRTVLVPECTPRRPESLHSESRTSTPNYRSAVSPTPAARTSKRNDAESDDDDDPIVFVSSTPAPNRPSTSTATSTVVILSDSDSSPPPSAKRPLPPITPSLRIAGRPAIHLASSDSDSDADVNVNAAPATPTRRPHAGTPRNTPRRMGGTMQKKLEILRTRFTPRRDEAGGTWRRRRATFVVDSDESDDAIEQVGIDSDEGVSDEAGQGGEWWDGNQEGDQDTYDSSFIDDSDDGDGDLESGHRSKPKHHETSDTPRLAAASATPTQPALTYAAFQRARDALTARAFKEFNERAFNNQLPSDLAIEWNKRLCTTAGRAWPSRFKPTTDQPVPPERKLADDGWVYNARVELSVKVLDCEEKLRRTLLHELCHVAAWLIDHVAKPPHGPRFWYWAKRATRAFPLLEVTTCHDYEINFKYTYVCTVCGYSFGRHSKSVDVKTQACGACKGGLLRLTVEGKNKVGSGQPTSTRKPSAYQGFVKERYGQVKQAGGGGRSHKEVMKVLSEMWAKEGKGKAAVSDAEQGAVGSRDDTVGNKRHDHGSLAAA